MSLHRANAKRNVRLAQMSALGLVALAGLLAAMSPPPPQDPAPPIDPAAGAAPAAEPAPIDYTPAIGVFSLAHKSDAKINNDEQEKPGEAPVPPAPAPQIADDPWPHFNYIGMVSGRHTYAIISDQDGVTQTVPQGDYMGDYLVLGISSEKVILSDCNDERREYVMVPRPDVTPPDTLLDTAAPPTVNPASGQATEMTGDTIHMPPDMKAANEQAERERIQAKAREMQEKRNQALKQSGQVPPTRPGPGSTKPRPMTPQPKPGNNKEPVK